MRPDQRSPEAQAYRKLYKTKAWQWARVAQLVKQPLCERCLAQDRVTVATTVNHRTPHKGNWALFIDQANHESSCKPCHDGPTQSEERLGYSKAIGADGWPVDSRHPANKVGT